MSYQPIKDIENKQIDGNDCECRSEMKPLPLLRTPVRDWAFFFFSIALFSFLGFLFGTWTVNFQHPILSSDGRLAPAGDIETRWTYNHTFSREPDLESEAAWGSLPPTGGAFIRNDKSGPMEMNVAMYHQLHCLHGIRVAYYLELSKTNETLREIMGDVRFDFGDHDARHTIHCFDYLRQALECAADSNLEPLNSATGHVDAWSTKRWCRNKPVLDDWAYQWRSSDRTGIV